LLSQIECKMIKFIKNSIEKLPYSISKLLVFVPFELRLGKQYTIFKKTIDDSETWDESQIEKYIVLNFDKIFQHSKQFNLYKEKYVKAGVFNLKIETLDDIKKVPPLKKEEVRKYFNLFNGKYLLNTGGTSGSPLAFYLDKNVWAREWAHMHFIWKKAGYSHTDLKFTFRGKDIGTKFIEYNCVHNEFIINTYKSPQQYLLQFFKILHTKKVKYFHGYPSAIYNFLKEIESHITENQKRIITDNIKCCFFGSEYPTPQIVNYIKDVWRLNYLSWYGHSEMCVLARGEMNNTNYIPLHTYGYAETENNELLGTSYHNFDMPLIRYNTGDVVNPMYYDNSVLKSFTIKDGRSGDFVIDKKGNSISLTSLIFGRHHDIFQFIDYIQVHQIKNGYVTFLISKSDDKKLETIKLMDLNNIDIVFDFLFINKPIRTKSGKVSLKLLELPKNIRYETNNTRS